ncbi:MAG: PEP/pyruvate-binding domain-containing protein [Chloroflexota bacterium]|nr:PEP/pyruvate-binding domain-containing protein [Chloroflexota bacterium]
MHILPIDSDTITLTNAGGKGINLSLMSRTGLPVPGGFIVATDAYRAFVEDNALQGPIMEALAATNMKDPAALQEASRAIRACFAAGQLCPSLRRALSDAYANLGKPAVAVRSSATAEDLPDMSFAGQQDTFLNVVGEQALEKALVDCWSSLWTARAIAYRQRNAIPQEDVALAVIIQHMIESEASGVLFTANPLTGKRTETVIDAVLGLGEALVSGQVEPDNYIVDNSTSAILAKTPGAKAVTIRGKEGGGTITTAIDGNRQALPDAAIVELARLGQQITQELYAGVPQDIEWAWADDQLILLQSRAITSLFPLPDGMPPEPLQVMFSLGHVQGMLDPFTPLGQDTLRLVLLSLAQLFGRHLELESQREVQVAGERLWVNFTPAMRHALFRRLARSFLGYIDPAARQALDSLWDHPQLAPTRRGLGLRAVRQLSGNRAMIALFIRAMRHPDEQRQAATRAAEAGLIDAQTRMRAAGTLADRLAVWDNLNSFFPDTLAPIIFPNLAAGMASFFQLRRLVSNQFGSDQLALEAARGLPHNVTTEMDLVLWTVAQVIQADPPSSARFAADDAKTLAEDYAAGSLPLAAQAAIAAFMDRYGMRGVAEIDLGRPRWRGKPAQIMQVIQSYVQIDDPTFAPDAVFRRADWAAHQSIDRIVRGIRNPFKARLARFFATRMRALAGLREYPKFAIIRLMGVVREGVLESGNELVAAGVLNRAEDLFFLRYRELQALAANQDRDWKALVAERRARYERETMRAQVPRLLLSDGTAFYEGIAAAQDQDGEGSITGTPVSPGIVEGIVRVVFDPHETMLLPGEILVCPGTDPAWTPLFLVAGGLVMEVGGLMTHGSVVAREYGIPAVVGVHRATSRLQTGQRIRVDGSTGVVTPLD